MGIWTTHMTKHAFFFRRNDAILDLNTADVHVSSLGITIRTIVDSYHLTWSEVMTLKAYCEETTKGGDLTIITDLRHLQEKR